MVYKKYYLENNFKTWKQQNQRLNGVKCHFFRNWIYL